MLSDVEGRALQRLRQLEMTRPRSSRVHKRQILTHDTPRIPCLLPDPVRQRFVIHEGGGVSYHPLQHAGGLVKEDRKAYLCQILANTVL